jgi:transcriptional regulator NrdR family protein
MICPRAYGTGKIKPMKCRLCRSEKHTVERTVSFLDSTILRTRVCRVCGYSWSTTESVDTDTDCLRRAAQVEDDDEVNTSLILSSERNETPVLESIMKSTGC